MNNDFTQGSILKKLSLFMLPVLGALILQAAYGAVDLLVVGQFGSTAGLSAVSTGSQVLNLVTFVVTQLAMGVTALIARYLGERRPERSGAVLGGARRGVHDPRGCDVRAAGGFCAPHRGSDAGAGGSRRADGKLCAHLRRRDPVHRRL